MTDRTLCLNMIVRNEVANLNRLLNSIANHIDCWIIADTGSADGTQDLVRAFFAQRGLPGELHDFPFVNFEQARNEALARAYASPLAYDYVLLADADMELVAENAGFRMGLEARGYQLLQRTESGLVYWNTRLVRRDAGARYRGVTHEFLEVPGGVRQLQGVWYKDHASGTNRVDKFERDIALLTGALETEQDAFLVARYIFYLAQSFRDGGEKTKAIDAYLRRAELGYWAEEVFWSLYSAARLKEELGHDPEEVISLYARASDAAPTRAEALHAASRLCRNSGRNQQGYDIAKRGLALSAPADGLFVESWIYEYGLLDEFAVNAYWAGHFRESLDACERILGEQHIPLDQRDRISANAAFSHQKLTPITAQAAASGAQLPVVCIFGADNITLYSSTTAPDTETRALDCRCFPDDRDLERVLIEYRPHVIVTFGVMQQFSRLMAARFEIRRRWLHFSDTADLVKVGEAAFLCYLAVCLDKREEEPLVSVFTPTYRTGDRFLRPLVSMKEQAYGNWEWVIWDDSDDDGLTATMVKAHADLDHRVRLIRPDRHSGVIGEVKYNACALSRGQILVELDHDDALTPDALALVVAAYKQFPEAGFYYTDYAEVDPSLNPLRYPDGWGFGLGSYRTELYRGRELLVANTPGISPKTIRHLVAAPNHLRAWRRDVYFKIGGHNREIHVADDLELMMRTFLETRMVHIPRLAYVQYQDGQNTQRVRNQDIQRHVRFLGWKYDRRIHDRFVALGVDDYMWDEQGGFSDFSRANPPVVQVASLTAEFSA
jgi:O-antigen biosynthesis protein